MRPLKKDEKAIYPDLTAHEAYFRDIAKQVVDVHNKPCMPYFSYTDFKTLKESYPFVHISYRKNLKSYIVNPLAQVKSSDKYSDTVQQEIETVVIEYWLDIVSSKEKRGLIDALKEHLDLGFSPLQDQMTDLLLKNSVAQDRKGNPFFIDHDITKRENLTGKNPRDQGLIVYRLTAKVTHPMLIENKNYLIENQGVVHA